MSPNRSEFARTDAAAFRPAIVRVARAAARLLHSWWSADRVRAAPHEGRLLRLRPGAFVMLDERVVEVVGRGVGQGAAGPFVVYDCQTARGAAQIRVATVGSVCAAQFCWIENGSQRMIAADDVEVWSP